MKINMKYALLGLLAVAGMTMTSCSDDETYDVVGNPNNLIYFKANATNTFTGVVTHTPAGDFGSLTAKFPVRVQRAVSKDTKVTAAVDNSLVAEYNAANGTDYAAMPESAVSLSGMTVTIPAGATAATDSIVVSLNESSLSALTESAYVLPIRITDVQGDGTGSEDRGVGYIVVTTSTTVVKDITSPEEMTGTLLTDYTGWTAKYSSNTTIDVSELFDGDLTNGAQLRTDEADGKTTTVVVNMGSAHKVSGLRVCRYAQYYTWWDWWDAYYFSAVKMEMSTDGQNWSDLGTADNMPQSDGYQYICFYGGVSMQYLRLTFDSGASSVSSLGELGVYVSE